MKKCKKCGVEKPENLFYPTYKGDHKTSDVCKNCHNDISKEQKERKMNYWTNKKYGVTIEEKRRMVFEQDNRCMICKKVFSNSQNTHIDHDHESKQVRGILCGNCNRALGYFNDNILSLEEAVRYLRKWSVKQ